MTTESVLIPTPVVYSAYIQPNTEPGLDMINSLKDRNIKSIVNTCIEKRDLWLRYIDSLLDTNNTTFGECFSHSIALCSLLRTVGYAESSCFVAVTCHISENYGNATHATVLVKHDDLWHVLDTTKDNLESAIWIFSELKDFTTYNRVLCIFNDLSGYIADGDGVILNIPVE